MNNYLYLPPPLRDPVNQSDAFTLTFPSSGEDDEPPASSVGSNGGHCPVAPSRSVASVSTSSKIGESQILKFRFK